MKENTDQRICDLLDCLEDVRNFLNEAPIEELEAIEAALERNAPISEINRATELVWLIHGAETEGS